MAEYEYRKIELHDGSMISYIELNAHSQSVVLLLHGLGSTASSWQLQFDTLTKSGFRVIAADVPGFGASEFRGKRWSIRESARLIVQFLDQLSITRACVAGISMGGVIALQLALDYPTRVEKLILINSFATLHPDRLDGWLYLLKRFLIANTRGTTRQAELVARRIFPGPDQEALRRILVEQIEQADPKVYKSAMVGLGLFDVRRRLKTIEIPTLVVSGTNDTTVPLKNQADMVQRIRGAVHMRIPGAGHAAIIDHPDEVNAALADFLQAGRAAG